MNSNKINLFNCLTTKDGKTTSIDSLVKLISYNPTAKKYKEDFIRLKKANNQLDAFNKSDLEKRKIKTLESTCIGAYFPNNNRSKGANYQFTQYVYLDYDAAENNFSSPEYLEYLKNEIIKIDFVKLVCTSSSGQGLSIIVAAEGIDSNNKYKGTYLKAAELIAKKVDNSLKADKQTIHANRLWILPHDPSVKFNSGVFKLHAVNFEKPATTQSPTKALNKIAFSSSSSSLYCDFLKPPAKDTFRYRIYAEDIILEDHYHKTDAGSVYIPEGKIVPIKPQYVGKYKWKEGERNKKLLPSLIKLISINKGITQIGFEKMNINLMNRFEVKWSNNELFEKAFSIKKDFDQGKFNMDQMSKLQKRFYPKSMLSPYVRSVIDKENNFILNKFILQQSADFLSNIIKHSLELPEYRIKKLTIEDIAAMASVTFGKVDKRRIKLIIDSDQNLQKLIENQNKESIISHKATYNTFCQFCDAMNMNATKDEIIDTLGIKQSTYYVYKSKFETIEGLDERTPNYKD